MKTKEEYVSKIMEVAYYGFPLVPQKETVSKVITFLLEEYTNQCQKDMARESIAFANFLKADFEMEDSESTDDIVWVLCGTRQTYTTDEIYDEFIKSKSLINSLNKQD